MLLVESSSAARAGPLALCILMQRTNRVDGRLPQRVAMAASLSVTPSGGGLCVETGHACMGNIPVRQCLTLSWVAAVFVSSTSLQFNSVFFLHCSSTSLQPPASQYYFSLTSLQH